MKNLSLLIVFFAFVSCSPLKKYADQKAQWEREVQALEALDKTETYPDDAILFIGSSSIRLWQNIAEDMKPYTPIRRGYGGAHFYDLIHFTDRLVSPHKVQAIVIFVANDITGDANDKSPKEVLRLFKATLIEIKKSHPFTPIFYVAVTPTPSRWKVWKETSEANALIQKYCEKKQELHFISTQDGFLGENGEPRKELYRADMLHLKQVGYDIWKEIIKTELDKNLNK